MDDIRIDDDPRKQSAKKIKSKAEQKSSNRSFLQFLIDWIVKSLLLTTILAIDFTLFANSGSYSIFTAIGSINMEAALIYAGIGVFSFVIMLLFMILLPLDNILLAAFCGFLSVALISQFALFDKNSALLLFTGNLFSDDMNVILYKYATWIIIGIVFLLSYIILKMFSRKWLFGLTIIAICGLGWLVSQAYFDPSKPIFYSVKEKVEVNGDNVGNNLVFLTFPNLTSLTNLHNHYANNPKNAIAKKTWQTALGFYSANNFKIYPNTMLPKNLSIADNLMSLYNPDTDKIDSASYTISQDGYFDFKKLHLNNNYVANSSLINNLKEKGFGINVYQSEIADICSNPKVDNCDEKLSYPIVMQADKVGLLERTIILFSQWIVSTGIIDSANPVLSVVRYVADGVKAYPFEVNKLGVINSFKTLDMIANDIERKGGNQAYFAVMDLPSDTFVYDEYCSLKNIHQWNSQDNSVFAPISLGIRQNSYFEQTMCLYGYLNKFMKRLKYVGMDENTTVIIAGLSTPSFLGNVTESDFYTKLQSEQSSALAIKSPKAKKYAIDYSVCLTSNVLDAYFSNRKSCHEFGFIKTTDKVIDNIRKTINANKISEADIKEADINFDNWFEDWAKMNNYIENPTEPIVVSNSEVAGEPEKNAEAPEDNMIDATIPIKVDDVVETPQDNITSTDAVNEADVKDTSNAEQVEEVIPDTLFDNGVEQVETTNKTDNVQPQMVEELPVQVEEVNSKAEEVISKEEVKEDANTEYDAPIAEDLVFEEKTDAVKDNVKDNIKDELNPKQGYDLNEVIAEAKRRASLSDDELKKEQEKVAKTTDKKISEAKKQAEQLVQTAKSSAQQKAGEVKSRANAVVINKNAELKDILVAPQTGGKKLSPEELKKQYHEMLKQSGVE